MSTAPPWIRAFGGWRSRVVRRVTISDPINSAIPDSFRESPDSRRRYCRDTSATSRRSHHGPLHLFDLIHQGAGGVGRVADIERAIAE
jgi:hypothetical protein